ncbi:MAG: aspartate aminotransferase family protein [Flavobacteriales bacterium]|nr:aspartate aminotransferase family protein [Flavobacteriales bacterium]
MYTPANLKTLESSLKEILNGLSASEKTAVVREHLSPRELSDRVDLSVKKEGVGEEAFLAKIRQVVDNSVKTDDPLFMNQMYGDQNLHAVIGDILTTVLNTSMYTYEVAPLMTLIEKECIRVLGARIGYKPDQADGVFTPGGSISNMMSMVLARDAKFPKARTAGLKEVPPFSIFVSEQAHYSFVKGGTFLGIGQDNIIKVKAEASGVMNILALCNAIEREKEKNRIPLMVVATAGTTITGVFDDIVTINEIARTNDMWFHVDAVWGGSLLFSDKEAGRLKGIELGDSVSWNLHKMMGIPIVCAAFLTRHTDALENSLSVVAPYLFHEKEEESGFDLGRKSLQCGRRVDALKLWTSLQFEGEEGFQLRIDNMMAQTHCLAKKISNEDEMSLFCTPQSPIVCFQYIHNDLGRDELNEINYQIRDRLFREGKIILNYSQVNGSVVLRCVVSNPGITEIQLDQIIENVLKQGRELAREHMSSMSNVEHS